MWTVVVFRFVSTYEKKRVNEHLLIIWVSVTMGMGVCFVVPFPKTFDLD